MIRYVPLAVLLAVSAGCQQNKPPTSGGSVAVMSAQSVQKPLQRETFLAELERRVASARRQPGTTPEMTREMDELLQTLRRSPNPELLLNAMLAGASPGPQIAAATPAELHQQAVAAEQLGLKQDALALYRRSAETGYPLSAARLRELEPPPALATPSAPAARSSSSVNVARLLAAGPSSSLAGNGISVAQSSPEEAFSRAAAFEQDNQLERALSLYLDSSQRGHGPASQRLMEIFANGAPGLTRDYVVAVKYKDLALRQGSQIELLPRR